ncbi:MAG: hypothetical protein AABZ53_02290 [Planctomycetota bacterium]
MENEPPPLSFAQKTQQLVNFLKFICMTFSAPVEVWLRRGFGDRYFSKAALFSVVLIPFWGTLFPGTDLTLLFGFWWSYFIMLLFARIAMFRRWTRGEVEHTLYSGYSRLHRFFPRASELKIKETIEPMLVFIIGVVFLTMSPALGLYLMVASFAMAVSIRITMIETRQRLLQLTDAAFEQRELAEAFRRVFP